MKIHDLKPAPGSKKRKKRVGRGSGSGLGTTAGKGHKGQKARSGGSVQLGFEGGQMPLIRRLPKRGFTNRFAKEYEIVNLGVLEEKFNDGEVVNIKTLKERNIIKGNKDGVKILGDGEFSKKLIIDVDKISDAAAKKVVEQGGEIK
jgi:large subunit ribosomal protein L15